jgi:ankyrin repeat protein
MDLLKAIQSDNADDVRKALKGVTDVNQPPPGKLVPPLSVAAKEGKLNAARALLKAGADPRAPDMRLNALAMAVDGRQVDLVKMLLSRWTFSPETLKQAAGNATERRSITMLALLRDAGADVKSQIFDAVSRGYPEVVDWLLKQGVKVNSRSPRKNSRDATLLHLAAEHGQGAVAKLLAARGADLNARDADGATPLHRATASEVDAAFYDRRSRLAAAEGRRMGGVDFGDQADFTVVDVLLDAGADGTIRNAEGDDAMRVFIANWRHCLDPGQDDYKYQENLGDTDFRRDLVRRILARLKAAGLSGGDADDKLIAACVKGNVKAIRRALADGARLSARNPADNRGYSALGYAIIHGHTDAVRLLLKMGADASDAGRSPPQPPYSPLAIAAHSKSEIIRVLLKAGVDTNGNEASQRPLIAAAGSGRADIVRLLLRAGADPNLTEHGDAGANALTRAKESLRVAKLTKNRKETAAYTAVIRVLESRKSRLPRPSARFAPGVVFPGTFTELLVNSANKTDVGKIGDAIAQSIDGTVRQNVWGRKLTAGPRSYAVIRLDGSKWHSVLGTTGAGIVIDDAWERLAATIAARCCTWALLMCYEDVSACGAYRYYEGGRVIKHFDEGLEELAAQPGVPESVIAGKFTTMRGTARPQHASTAITSMAKEMEFRTLSYGPSAQPGEEFTFEIPGLTIKVAEAAYVTT